MFRSSLPLFILSGSILLLGNTAHATVLDWSSAPASTWTAGTTSNSYDVDSGNTGNDVSVAVTPSTTGLFSQDISAGNPQTPAVTKAFAGGLSNAVNTLTIALNLPSQSANVSVSVGFNYVQGVRNVSYQLFDIDRSTASSSNNYEDLVNNIYGVGMDGVTQIAPTITFPNGSTVLLGGSGVSQTLTGTSAANDTGNGSVDGTAVITFGTTPLQSITFTYGDGPDSQADPTFQHLGLYNISFTPVPEMNPALIVNAVCVLAALFFHRHVLGRRRL